MKVITTPYTRILYFALMMAAVAKAFGQEPQPIQVATDMSDEDLVNALVDNDCAAISNVTINGEASQRATGTLPPVPIFPLPAEYC